MAYSLRCPDCRGKFPWTKEKRFPRHCPLCNSDLGEERADDDVVMPFFRSAKTKAIDKVYADTETGSEFRMQAAAEMAGTTAAEMAGLKITDLKDTRPGEIAAKDVSNPVSQFMAQNHVGGFQGSNGVGFSGAVQTGPFANSGAKFQNIIRQSHAELTGFNAVGDRPALEVMQPGYRRRS